MIRVHCDMLVQATRQKLEERIPGTVALEEHVSLKDKVRDLENCLHEMQEEFEEVGGNCMLRINILPYNAFCNNV